MLSTFILKFGILCLALCSLLGAAEVQHAHLVLHSIPKCGTHCLERTVTLLTGKNIFHLIHQPFDDEILTHAEQTNQILRLEQPYYAKDLHLIFRRHYKLVSIYRDPRDALISHLFYMRELKDRGTKRDFFIVSPNFDELSFKDQLTALITGTPEMKSYLNFYKERIPWALNFYSLSVKYEDLLGAKGGKSEAIQRQAILNIANHIGMELSSQKLDYVVNNLYVKADKAAVIDGKVFARAATGNWAMFFTPEHKELFKKKMGKLLIQLGYEKDQNW